MAVLLGLTLLTVVVLEFAFAMRLEASAGHAFKQDRLAAHLAEAAVQQALVEIASGATVMAMDAKGQLTFYRTIQGSTLASPLPALDRERVPLGAGAFSYRITDEEARLDVNLATPERMRKLLEGLGLDREARDVVVDSLEDWKDADELHRVNGAESDYYLRLPVPYRARNGLLQDLTELRQIRGVTAALFEGAPGKPGLAALTTVHGRGTININSAPAPVLAALGLPEAAVTEIVRSRARAPYTVVPARFEGMGLAVSSGTFRIEAEGRTTEGPRLRITAVVRRRAPQPSSASTDVLNTLGLAVLAWRTGEIR